MTLRWVSVAAIIGLLAGCTGGQETTAQEIESAREETAVANVPTVDPEAILSSISPAIPLYGNVRYRADLSQRDTMMIENQYGKNAKVYTLASNDSFPQVWHYYVTYLSQFRGYQPDSAFPANRDWRTLEIHLNKVMTDSFGPGDDLEAGTKNVILQVAETESEPATVIRYIVTPDPIAAAPAVLAP